MPGWISKRMNTNYLVYRAYILCQGSFPRRQRPGDWAELDGSRPIHAEWRPRGLACKHPQTFSGRQECALMAPWLFWLSTLCRHGVLWLTLRRTFFLGRSSSGFHTSHWTSWGSLGFSSVWSWCQQPPIFFSLVYFLILAKIWLAPCSKK